MRGERGQASVEWIGALLAAALALGALARLADRVEATTLGTTLLRSTTCAAGGGCGGEARGDGERRRPSGEQRRPAARMPNHAVTALPLVPLVPMPAGPRAGFRRPRGGLRRALEGLRRPRISHPTRRRAGALWRRAWLICFGYERVRYGLLHPETRPRQTVPVSGVLQMANDCLSPIDFARDWELLRPR